MKFNTNPKIEMLGDLISPQRDFYLRNGPQQFHQRVRPVIQLGVVVERVTCRGAVLDMATPVMSVELENVTHRLPLFQFSSN